MRCLHRGRLPCVWLVCLAAPLLLASALFASDPPSSAPPAGTDAKPAERVQLAQAGSTAGAVLSPADQVELAYEYAWQEDYEAERALLEQAIPTGPSRR